MPRRYKRKRLAEEWAQDIKPKKFGNYFNKAERQRAKREIAQEPYQFTPEEISEFRWEIESQLSHDCYVRECEAVRTSQPFNCECPNVSSWSDEEVLKYLGLV